MASVLLLLVVLFVLLSSYWSMLLVVAYLIIGVLDAIIIDTIPIGAVIDAYNYSPTYE